MDLRVIEGVFEGTRRCVIIMHLIEKRGRGCGCVDRAKVWMEGYGEGGEGGEGGGMGREGCLDTFPPKIDVVL